MLGSSCSRALGILAVSLLSACPPPLAAQSLPDKAVERLENVIDRTLRDQKIPGFAIGIVRDGRVVYSRGFGSSGLDDPPRPVTPETL